MRSSLVRQVLILAAVALAPAVGEAIWFRDKISWTIGRFLRRNSVTVDQARTWGGTVIWVDARPDEEFARDHVPGALSLNEDRWNELLPQFLAAWSPGKKVVVYCSAESCDLAREVARTICAKKRNFLMCSCFEGGWEAWLKKNR